jgi:excisionase family DNA binding protein
MSQLEQAPTPHQHAPTPDWVGGVPEAAEYLGVSVRWIRRHLGEIPHHKLGLENRFTRAQLDAFLASTVRHPS